MKYEVMARTRSSAFVSAAVFQTKDDAFAAVQRLRKSLAGFYLAYVREVTQC